MIAIGNVAHDLRTNPGTPVQKIQDDEMELAEPRNAKIDIQVAMMLAIVLIIRCRPPLLLDHFFLVFQE